MSKENMKRVSLWIPTIIAERLDVDSVRYGASKSDIIRVALLNYYKQCDNAEVLRVE